MLKTAIDEKDAMRLQAQDAAKYKGKTYKKFWLVVPVKIVKKMGWKHGDEISADPQSDKLILTKAKR